MLTILTGVLLTLLIMSTALAVVAFSAHVALTPGLTPCKVVVAGLSWITARRAMKSFEHEWAQNNTPSGTR